MLVFTEFKLTYKFKLIMLCTERQIMKEIYLLRGVIDGSVGKSINKFIYLKSENVTLYNQNQYKSSA